ncbi:MAG: MopE-related protein [Polyangia bacterium]
MRHLMLHALLCVLLLPSLAHATVTEPDPTLVLPRDSMNGETQLYTLFSNQGETINYQTDGHDSPSTFSPLCSFTATFVLKQASSSLGLAWYNSTSTAPPDSDLHTIVPAGSPVGTVISSSDIRNDPSYLGGVIGFALVGGQTHYSEPQWNVFCSTCADPGNWILAVIYKSVVHANSYYMAFEDGPVSSTSFGNDGDFNDDVYLLSGLACSGAGDVCDTGMQGVCAAGITNCNSTGAIVCQQAQPPATEACDGLDNDCNGSVDDGAMCPSDQICSHGACIQRCNDGEFPCQGSLVCSDGLCIDQACVGVTCAGGQTCTGGTCHGGCQGVICPGAQVCRAGACVDPCDGVTCGTMQVCKSGICIATCDCQVCAAGLTCATNGACVDAACTTVKCTADTTCKAGVCVDSCMGVVCPYQQVCQSGACVAAPPALDMATASDLSNSAGPDDGVPGDGGVTNGDGGDLMNGSGKTKGCGCDVGGRTPSSSAAVLLVLFALLGLHLSRRDARRTRSPRRASRDR